MNNSYETVVKQALELLDTNFDSAVVAAQRLLDLNLHNLLVDVDASRIRLESLPITGRGTVITIDRDGEICGYDTIRWQNGCVEIDQSSCSRNTVDDVTQLLGEVIGDLADRANLLERVAQGLEIPSFLSGL